MECELTLKLFEEGLGGKEKEAFQVEDKCETEVDNFKPRR